MLTLDKEKRLDAIYKRRLELIEKANNALVEGKTGLFSKLIDEANELKREQVEVVAKALGYEVENIDYTPEGKRYEKFWFLKNGKRFLTIAVFSHGRLKALVRARRSGYFARVRYLVNGQALRGSVNIYFRS